MTNIIVYDDGGSPFAARAWWLLQYAGFKNSFIALEGFEAIKEAGFPVDNVYARTPVELQYHLQWDEKIYAPRQFVEETVAGETASVLLDARSAERYRGEQSQLIRLPGAKLASRKWNMFVLNEQWERFPCGQVSDGKLLVFALVNPSVFEGFATTTIMSANFEKTVAYQHLVQHGHTFRLHKAITSKLLYTGHNNGHLLTVHYAVEDGNWSKRRREKQVQVGADTYSVNDLVVSGALDLFGDDQFAWLANKDIEGKDPSVARHQVAPYAAWTE